MLLFPRNKISKLVQTPTTVLSAMQLLLILFIITMISFLQCLTLQALKSQTHSFTQHHVIFFRPPSRPARYYNWFGCPHLVVNQKLLLLLFFDGHYQNGNIRIIFFTVNNLFKLSNTHTFNILLDHTKPSYPFLMLKSSISSLPYPPVFLGEITRTTTLFDFKNYAL